MITACLSRWIGRLFVKRILDGKKKKVPKKMWTLDGAKLKFSGNYTGEVDASQYIGGTTSGNSAS